MTLRMMLPSGNDRDAKVEWHFYCAVCSNGVFMVTPECSTRSRHLDPA
jgi:hypothetical protein